VEEERPSFHQDMWPMGMRVILACFAVVLFIIWWTDPATHDVPPPWEHCSGGRCWYDDELRDRIMRENERQLELEKRAKVIEESPQYNI